MNPFYAGAGKDIFTRQEDPGHPRVWGRPPPCHIRM